MAKSELSMVLKQHKLKLRNSILIVSKKNIMKLKNKLNIL